MTIHWHPMTRIAKPTATLFTTVLITALALSGCDKAEQPAPPAETDTPVTTVPPQEVPVVVPTEPTATPTADKAIVSNETEAATPMSGERVDDSGNQVAPPGADPDVAIIGTQLSNVDYKNDSGQSLKVIYETSVSGELNAITTLPSGKKVTLTATAGQGNNPTYTSADGSIDLVSHAGGGSIDLIQNGQPTSFKAVSAEAEVIPQ